MFALRVGSRPSFISGAPTVENEGKELRQCPVRKLARGEEAELSAEREGMKLVAILDLSTSTSAEGHGLLTFPLPAFPTVPRYHLAPFLSAALVPPASPSSTPPDQQQDDPLTALRQSLDGLRTLFARRRMDQVQGEEQEENLEGAVYALYAPTGAGEGSVEGKGEVGAVEDVVPLLLALWRCALWCGEGWGEV